MNQLQNAISLARVASLVRDFQVSNLVEHRQGKYAKIVLIVLIFWILSIIGFGCSYAKLGSDYHNVSSQKSTEPDSKTNYSVATKNAIDTSLERCLASDVRIIPKVLDQTCKSDSSFKVLDLVVNIKNTSKKKCVVSDPFCFDVNCCSVSLSKDAAMSGIQVIVYPDPASGCRDNVPFGMFVSTDWPDSIWLETGKSISNEIRVCISPSATSGAVDWDGKRIPFSIPWDINPNESPSNN